ncbi:unnamed protein product [Cyclocybe aegerita]|uniref:Ubiquitin-like domain-containing protein n=1 Tax=Cyclocybe aegerita TaxID=1973307 RepID=A0A8S0Y0V9_CYCAE|nr:unnamed protein product [Cyclocybe aegerita]
MAFAPSIGNLVTLSTIIASIVRAVNETSGASAEYKELVDELNSFCNMLTILRHTLENTTVSPNNELAFNSIHMEMARCRALVDAFVDTIHPYHRALNAAGGTGRRRRSLRVIFRKVWWALFRQEDVTKVQLRMMSHRLQIVVLLNSLSLPVVQAAASNEITTQVGYKRENGIEIVDFMNKTFVIPWELCYSLLKIRLTLQSYYQHTPGQTQAEWGDYTLFCEDLGGLQVDVRDHYDQLRRGMRLTMAALTWRHLPEGRLSEYKCTQCPRTISVEHIDYLGWVEWEVSFMIFLEQQS